MSEQNRSEKLDRVLDAALARAAGEPVPFDVAAGKLALRQALRERAASGLGATAVADASTAVTASASTTPAGAASAGSTLVGTTPADTPAADTTSAGAATSTAVAPVVSLTSRRTRTRWLAAAAAVGVLTAGALAASTVDTGTGPSATAAEELIHAADLADRVTVPPLGPGQYLYVRSRYRGIVVESGSDKAWTSGAATEEWVPADHRDEWLLRTEDTGPTEWLPGHEGDGKPDPGRFKGKQEFRGKCGKYSYYAEGQPDRCTNGSFSNPTPEFVASLPSDPRALYEKLKADGGTDDPGVLMQAREALDSGRMPARVRADIFRALALLPGLVVTEKRANLDGEEGVALGIKYYEDFQEIIIDPADGDFIGSRSTVAEKGTLDKGTVRSSSSVSTAVVGSLGTRP
ncbi:CU044_5270 family protein [Nocardia sp. NRRL S-836]|uniref:CU044_5270 family protein n=1 Tax=Nocardia sp. NRRL S-836 TaxID=1519492 RepID=UPI0006AF6774|nr:CU044_5270 family protein [Nocardia sp. NRRL S-836]KOV82899.1 hypothetical protein ADL03_22865 [Nocardia sp. NRRL S-836]